MGSGAKRRRYSLTEYFHLVWTTGWQTFLLGFFFTIPVMLLLFLGCLIFQHVGCMPDRESAVVYAKALGSITLAAMLGAAIAGLFAVKEPWEK
jgi:hypothetical protein